MNTVLVTGATGNVGRQVVAQLAGTGARVRAMSRSAQGANVVRADLSDVAQLRSALGGVDTVFLVWTAPAEAAPASINEIARHARRIVFLSSPHQTPHPFFQQPNPMAAMHAAIEKHIRDSGLRWTFLRPGMFARNTIGWWAGQIRGGDVVRWPYGDAATAPIDERDIARVAVRALLDDTHDGHDYVLTGPQSLTQREQVTVIGDAIGRRLRFEEIAGEDVRSVLPAPAPILKMLMNAWAAAVGLPAYVTATVGQVTGTPARSFAEWARDNAGAFR